MAKKYSDIRNTISPKINYFNELQEQGTWRNYIKAYYNKIAQN